MNTKHYAIRSSEIENCTFDNIMEFQTEQERDQWATAEQGREALADMDFLGLDVDDYYRIPEGKHFRLINTTRMERAARKALARQGCHLQKNTKNLETNPYHSGCYRIIDNNNFVVAGESFDMTIEDVLDFINDK